MTNQDVEEEPLSPVARVSHSPVIDSCIVIIVGFKTKISPDVVLDALKQNVSKHPRFSSILSENGAKWIKTEVNVEDHVIVPNIETTEIGEDGQSFVDDYISRLTMIPLDKSRPFWDIHILNVKTSDAEAVCFIRSHHSLGDAMSLISLMLACTHKTSSDPDILMSNAIPSMKRRAMHNHENKGVFLRTLLAIGSTMRLIWNTIVDMFLVWATLFLKDTKTPLKADDNATRQTTRFYHRVVSLDDIKLIKNAMNMTINDVLIGITQASFSRYLSREYDKMNKDNGAFTPCPSNLPDGIRFRATFAINLRSDTGLKPLADMMLKDSKCRWGNYVSTILLPFSIGLQTDPLAYLKISKSMMARKKHSYQAALMYSFTKITLKLFGVKAARVLYTRAIRNTTTSVSNVIGPMEEISFRGHPVAYIALSCYGQSQQALLIHFISYADKMIISMAYDPTVIPEPHKICDDMEESLKEMKASLCPTGLL